MPRDVSPRRPPRADAVRNRESVLAAARERFAAAGSAAQMDDIAAQAGVSVATVYRHFPDKASLFASLVAENSARAEGFGRAALAVVDPWTGFAQFLTRCAELQAESRGLCEALVEGFAGDRWAEEVADAGLLDVTAVLIARGQAAGVIRADITPGDVALVIGGLAGAMLGGPSLGGDWRRLLDICLRGMRPPTLAPSR